MHDIQQKLLSLAAMDQLQDMSYREMASRIGGAHASQIKHHLEQLIKHGRLMRNSNGQLFVVGNTSPHNANVLSIPILGEADCGEATRYASDEIQGYLAVSPSMLPAKAAKKLFALRARGNSMNDARVCGNQPIEDGDYVLVEKAELDAIKDKDYVVSIIQGLANIKRWRVDRTNNRIVLMPESKLEDFSPIFIAEEDIENYQVAGKVVGVIHGTRHLV